MPPKQILQKDGYHQAMLDLGTFNGEVYGLPYSVSLPVGYYNMDNLNAVGITELPTTWDEVIAACHTLMDAGHKTPMWWALECHWELVFPSFDVEPRRAHP